MDIKILVVDDEQAIADIIKFNFEREGYGVDIAKDGLEALNFVKDNTYSLILLDIMMPKLNGFDTLKEIRKSHKIPVIMLTAREDEVDKVLGLELGADDYVVKPFSIRELIARVKAVLRRFGPPTEEEGSEDEIITVGELEIDINKYEVKKNGKIIDLTLREFELLKFLSSNPGVVFSREELLEKVDRKSVV